MLYATLLKEVEEHIFTLFKNHHNTNLLYHNFKHTEKVVAHSLEIAGCNLNDRDLFILIAAAWFHDVGYLFVEAKHHEEESIARMKQYFKTKNITEDIVDEIETCIQATKYPPNPKTFLEKIICDADTYNFGTAGFSTTDELVRKETELTMAKQIDNWNSATLLLLNNHHFFTVYCKNKLNEGKKQNIKILEHLLESNN